MRRFSLISLVLIGVMAQPLWALQGQPNRGRAAVAASATIRSAASTLSASSLSAAKRIKAARLRDDLYFISSDAMGGRDTPSRGLDETAKFIAARLKRAGVKPAGDDGTYFQRIELSGYKVDEARTRAEMETRNAASTRPATYTFGEDFLVGAVAGAASGALVYVGHGWKVKSKNINSYDGIDVRDKIMIVSGGLPKGVKATDVAGKAGENWEDPSSYARRHGARGLIMIPRNRDFDRWWSARRRALERTSFEVERFQKRDNPGALPMIMPSKAMVNALFNGEKLSGEEVLRRTAANEAGAAFDLAPDKKISFTVNIKTETATTQNVIGVLEGRDPVLKREHVAVGAHYDHVGVGRPVNGDSIYNGADDDGSGTVAVLAMAEAFARGGARPKRSILFVWHAAEEKGLWGSQYFTDNPTVPLDQIIAQLNIDMIGRSKRPGDTNPDNRELTGPNEIYVIGSKLMSTELGQLSERVNREYLNLDFNYLYDDPADPNRFFFRSDHFNYARKNIPIIFYFDGVHEDYHKPSDTADKIDYRKMEKVTRTIFMTAAELASAPRRPLVDKQLSPDRTER